MDDLRSRLAEWRSDGLLTVDQEEAIAARAGVPDAPSTDRRLLEALTYLGAVFFLYGALVIAFDVGLPDDIFFDTDANFWGVFLLSLAASIALGVAAWLLSERTSHPVGDRAIGLTLLAAFVAFAVAELVFVLEIIDFGKATTIVVGLAFLAVAFPLYRWRPGAPTHLPFAIGSVVTIAGVLALLFGEDEVLGSVFGFDNETTLSLVAGVLYLAFGLGWMHLADRGYLVPRNLGYLLGGGAAFAGGQFFTGIAQGWVIVPLALGVFIVLAGVWRRRTILMGIGTAITVTSFAQLLELLFEDSALSAGILMAVLGAGVLAAVIVRSDSVPGAPTAMRMPVDETPPETPADPPEVPPASG